MNTKRFTAGVLVEQSMEKKAALCVGIGSPNIQLFISSIPSLSSIKLLLSYGLGSRLRIKVKGSLCSGRGVENKM